MGWTLPPDDAANLIYERFGTYFPLEIYENPERLYRGAVAALSDWGECLELARAQVEAKVAEELIDQADNLVEAAYYAGLRALLDLIRGYRLDVDVGYVGIPLRNRTDFLWWCRLQNEVLDNLPASYTPPFEIAPPIIRAGAGPGQSQVDTHPPSGVLGPVEPVLWQMGIDDDDLLRLAAPFFWGGVEHSSPEDRERWLQELAGLRFPLPNAIPRDAEQVIRENCQSIVVHAWRCLPQISDHWEPEPKPEDIAGPDDARRALDLALRCCGDSGDGKSPPGGPPRPGVLWNHWRDTAQAENGETGTGEHADSVSTEGAAAVDLPPFLPELDTHLHAIHYSQELQEKSTSQTPPVSAIIVEHVLSGQQYTFAAAKIAERRRLPLSELVARLPELEKQLLGEFFDFVAARPDAIWLHWGMRKPTFGFDVLEQRARLHGLEPVDIPLERRFDLDQHLKNRYGDNYTGNPRLWHAIHRNGVAKPGLLDQTAAARAWSRSEYTALIRALSAKVAAIRDLLHRVRQGNFQTGAIDPPAPCTPETPSTAPQPPAGDQLPPPERPRWDVKHRALHYGTWHKKFDRAAPNQEKLLAAFEKAGWPDDNIDDPFDSAGKLGPTIEYLNKILADWPLRFLRDGTGDGVRWEKKA
jgi:hypothetical protein